jgi:hypothetical protein
MRLHAGERRTEMGLQRDQSLSVSTGNQRLFPIHDHHNHELRRLQVSDGYGLLLRGRRRRRGMELQQRRLSRDAANWILCRLARRGFQLRLRGDGHRV